MKITKRRLNQIIIEETREALKEQERDGGWGLGSFLGAVLSTAPAFRAAHGGAKKLGAGLETEKARKQLKKCIQKKCKKVRGDEYWDKKREKVQGRFDRNLEYIKKNKCEEIDWRAVEERTGYNKDTYWKANYAAAKEYHNPADVYKNMSQEEKRWDSCSSRLSYQKHSEWRLKMVGRHHKEEQKSNKECQVKCAGELTGFSGLDLGTPQQKAYAKKLAQAIHDGDLAKEQLQKIIDCAEHTVTSAMDDFEAIWDAIVGIPTAKKRVAGGHITKINGVVVHEEKRYVNDSLAATGKAINSVASIFFKWQDDECLKKSMDAIGGAIWDFVTGDSDEEVQRRARIRANRQLKLDVEYKNKYGSKPSQYAGDVRKPDWGRGGKPPPGHVDPRTGLARARRGGGGPMTARGSGQKRTPPGRATAPDQRRGRKPRRQPRIPTARR